MITQQVETLTVLLVEDNGAHAELVIRSLQEHRVTNHVMHVKDGEAALDYLFRRGEYEDPAKSPRPHVVLLDLRLPKLDGLEVLQHIRGDDELTRLPVVILSTSEAERDIAQAYDRHANSYVVKPLDFAVFTRLMDEMAFYWLGWNQYPWA